MLTGLQRHEATRVWQGLARNSEGYAQHGTTMIGAGSACDCILMLEAQHIYCILYHWCHRVACKNLPA